MRRRIRGLDADERSAQRRRQLLAAATELFARQSYSGTSIEQICQQAYVGTKGFYDHFDSKEACYTALLEQITAQIQQRVAETAADTEGHDWPDRLRALTTAFVHAIADDPRLAKVTFGEAGGISPPSKPNAAATAAGPPPSSTSNGHNRIHSPTARA